MRVVWGTAGTKLRHAFLNGQFRSICGAVRQVEIRDEDAPTCQRCAGMVEE